MTRVGLESRPASPSIRRPENRNARWLLARCRSSSLVDSARRIVTVRGKRIDLTPTEFKLLSCMVRNEGRVLPHRYLLTEVWGPEYADEVDYVKLYVRYLRLKLEENPSDPTYILTEWGVGYRFSRI